MYCSKNIYLIKFKSVYELLPIQMLFATLKVTNEMMSARGKRQMFYFTKVHIIFIDKKMKFFNQIPSDLWNKFAINNDDQAILGPKNNY